MTFQSQKLFISSIFNGQKFLKGPFHPFSPINSNSLLTFLRLFYRELSKLPISQQQKLPVILICYVEIKWCLFKPKGEIFDIFNLYSETAMQVILNRSKITPYHSKIRWTSLSNLSFLNVSPIALSPCVLIFRHLTN